MNGLPEPPVEPPEPTILTGTVMLCGTFSINLRCTEAAACTSKDEMIDHAMVLMNGHADHIGEFDFDCMSNDVFLDGQNPMGD